MGFDSRMARLSGGDRKQDQMEEEGELERTLINLSTLFLPHRRFPHFRVDIEDLSIHFIHVKSKHPGAIPIVLIHGWPSSFLEFFSVIDSLVDPPEGVQAFVSTFLSLSRLLLGTEP